MVRCCFGFTSKYLDSILIFCQMIRVMLFSNFILLTILYGPLFAFHVVYTLYTLNQKLIQRRWGLT